MGAKMLSLSVFLVVYAVYHLTLIPSVPGGDSGELLAESCLLGTAHPPGYPLFTVISHIVEKIKFPRFYFDNFSIVVDLNSSVAWQVNHICAVFGALTATFIYLSTIEVVKSTRIDFHHFSSVALGALLYAFSPLIWEYSTTAEVFALNNCLCSALIYLACKVFTSIQSWTVADDANRSSRLSAVTMYTLLGALTSGLALSNQHASLLQVSYLVPYIFYLLFVSRVPRLLSLMVRAGLCFLIGVSPYAYLPLASMRPTPGSWGDQTTLSGFMRHVLRLEYGTFQLGVIVGEERAVERIVIYLGNVSAETGHALFPVIVMGFVLTYFMSCVDSGGLVAADRVTTESSSSNKKMIIATATTTSKQTPNSKTSKKNSNSLNKYKTDNINASKNAPLRGLPRLPLALLGLWTYYTLLWHCVLSNLPLSSPMPFAVHSRFWMQPNIVLYILMGVGSCVLSNFVTLRIERAMRTESSTQTERTPHSRGSPVQLLDTTIVVAVFSALMFHRFALQDRSKSGVLLRQYASLALSSLPPSALLLSHTDLDWNPVRYLRHCENYRPDVTHLSFQLMPYPWFAHKQAALYPKVHFTPQAFSFRGVSAERSSEGNARMIRTFLSDNGIDRTTFLEGEGGAAADGASPFPGGVFLDMQSVSEVEIGALSAWRGLHLQPWGTLYRVYSLAGLTMEDYRRMQHASVARLDDLVRGFPAVDAAFVAQYPAGSWEFAAASVFCDAHYQLGLNLLTFSMELQKNVSMEVLPLLLDRLLYANRVLSRALQLGLSHGTISSSLHDLHKNSALSSMRLHAVIGIVSQYQKETLQQFHKQHKANKSFFLSADAISSLLTPKGIATAQDAAIELMGGFVAAHPSDRDAGTFRSAVDKLVESRRQQLGGV